MVLSCTKKIKRNQELSSKATFKPDPNLLYLNVHRELRHATASSERPVFPLVTL